MVFLPVEKLVSNDMAVRNRIVVNSETYVKLSKSQYYELKATGSKPVVCMVDVSNSIKPNGFAISKVQREWCNVAVGDMIELNPVKIDMKYRCIGRVVIELGFFNKKERLDRELKTEDVGKDFLNQFENFPFSQKQTIAYRFQTTSFKATVVEINLIDYSAIAEKKDLKQNGKTSDFGILIKNSQVIFQKAPDCEILLTGSSKKINTESRQLVDPNWDFSQIGVGGLDHEFNIIFRRAFSSRIFPPEIVEDLGLKHVRGILLYGPPGTGKTLLARQIGKMLNSREPKIINGPEILNKFVGESEANIRKLFEDAEEEQRLKGVHSSLHLIIFDEIDAICKQRGQSNRGTAVHDTVVNQLLSKIDGVDQLNNILIIGMTNRRDLIDSALLRPGRFEIQLEIGLPNQEGRSQILSIHTDRLRKFDKLDPSVDLDAIAESTKNFSGAELEGLVRAATTTAMNRLVKLNKGKVEVSDGDKNYNNFKIFHDDFLNSLKFDIKPAFGVNLDDEAHLHKYLSNGVIVWSDSVQKTVEKLDLMIDQTRNGHLISPVSVLIEGDDGAGKTALAINLALKSKFPLVRMCSPEDMIGMSEFEKCNHITKLFLDLSKSDLSCVVIDNIERIVDYVAIGPRFSNSVLQTLFVLIKQKTEANKKLLIACTTSSLKVLEAMEFSKIFTTVIHVPNIKHFDHMNFILQHYKLFNSDEIENIVTGLKGINFSIKNLLSLCEIAVQLPERGLAISKVVDLLNEEFNYKSQKYNSSFIL